jgi:type I restriction enzyme, S subunit
MMENIFITCLLEDIAQKGKGAIISGPFGSNISSKFFQESGVPVIRGNNLSNSIEKFIDNGFVFISEKKADELNAYAIKDDIIFTAAGTIGQVGLIEANSKYKKYVISNK